MTTDPKLGCLSHSIYKMAGSSILARNEIVVAANPPVVQVFSSSQSLPDENFYWQLANDKIDGPLKFFRYGELLPDFERTMFENNFNNQVQRKSGKAKKICAVFSDAPLGRTINYIYDERPSENLSFYFSYHTPENLPPLELGAKSMLFAK